LKKKSELELKVKENQNDDILTKLEQELKLEERQNKLGTLSQEPNITENPSENKIHLKTSRGETTEEYDLNSRSQEEMDFSKE